MIRFQSNEKKTFSETLKASSQETEAALRQRRSEMDQGWDDVDQGWKDLQQGMAEIGITGPSDSDEGMVRLNVGGSLVNVRRSVLDGKQGSSFSGWTLGNLFEARWDKRLPTDTDGRVVLDESPFAVKHLVHTLLAGSSAAGGAGGMMAHEKPYLPFVSRALGLSGRAEMVVSGGSTIIGTDVQATSTVALQGWFPGETLELKYRSTRDGWTPAAFHAKCDDSSKTVTLFQVGSGPGASIVGGFSDVAWKLSGGNQYSRSLGAFLFMLKDGTGSGQRASQPVKWGIKHGLEHYAMDTSSGCGPCFGYGYNSSHGDLTSVNGGTRRITDHNGYHLYVQEDEGNLLRVCNNVYSIPAGSPILSLNGCKVTEIEVFGVSPTATAVSPSQAGLSAPTNSNASDVMSMKGEDDVRNFGVVIAGSLMEERMALRDAEIELQRARATVSAAAQALEAVYGPDIAAGKEDPVVELSVRGTRMTTLRSTLQVCPDSALATRFDEARWPTTAKDVDEHGRRVVDCSPSVFAKVLDVLRMRKRTSWASGETQQWGAKAVRVAVKAVDREAFEEFVKMYFPGCESFVNDLVEFLEDPQAAI